VKILAPSPLFQTAATQEMSAVSETLAQRMEKLSEFVKRFKV